MAASLSLSDDGPVLEILISLTSSRRYALNRFQLPIPAPLAVRALIDTGATYSCIDLSVVSQLNLLSSYEVMVFTPGTGGVPQQMKQYEVDVEVPNVGLFPRIAAIEAALSAQGIQALIGRDILARCLFVFDGPANSFSISV